MWCHFVNMIYLSSKIMLSILMMTWMNDEICARVGVWSHWEIKPVTLKTAIWSSHNFFKLSNFTFNCIWYLSKCNRKQSTLTSIVKSVKLFLACCIRYVLQFLKCMWGSTTVLPKGRIIVHLYTHILKFYFCLLRSLTFCSVTKCLNLKRGSSQNIITLKDSNWTMITAWALFQIIKFISHTVNNCIVFSFPVSVLENERQFFVLKRVRDYIP